MNNFFKGVLITPLFISSVYAQSDDSNFVSALKNGKFSGELRSIYAGYDQEEAGEPDTHATAIGAILKYETEELNGFSAAATVNTSYDVGFASGERAKSKHFNGLSSSDEDYSVLSEAYLNYTDGGLNLRAGRQLIDTPLADSDDIRMIPNTFEAYIATYELDSFSFMLGNLQEWQGFDAGLDLGWEKTGEDGTWLGSVTYSKDDFEASVWYYDIRKKLNAVYLEASYTVKIDDDMSLLGSAQYLNQSERSNSGEEASIYGVLAELSAYDFSFSLAYNLSEKQSGKVSFSGFGGGTLFTSMDIMILDNITEDRDSSAVFAGISYEVGDATLYYAYGDFDGDADSGGSKENIVEQDIGFLYSVIKDQIDVSGAYIISEDKENVAKTSYDWNRFQLMVSYRF